MTHEDKPPFSTDIKLVQLPSLPSSASRPGWRMAQTRLALQRALSAKRLTHEGGVVWGWWPTLQNTAVALCAHLGDMVRTQDDTPLAHDTVFRAVVAFNEAVNRSGHIDDGVNAFLRVIAETADELLRYLVWVEDAKGRRHYWRPFNQSFHDWQSEHAGHEVRIGEAPFVFPDEVWAARRMLATFTMTPSDFGRYFAAGVSK